MFFSRIGHLPYTNKIHHSDVVVLHWSVQRVCHPKRRPGDCPGSLVQMLDRQRVQQAAVDEAKKLVDAAALAAERLVDAKKEAEETATAASCTVSSRRSTGQPEWFDRHYFRGSTRGTGI